ncbi:hypothetical protein E2C01_056569 [Portunus trituberculatus]|uniref:Uncharacterized protein n=1 Tax=Portunus trituberculatus TaxID=210409 RepID=A0A5B7GYL0_PORTR|nr:hypothetical protein [Portunus trituberculatus]
MVPKRLVSDEIKNLVRVQVLVSHSTPLVDSQESHQEKCYKDVFMDGDSSSSDLPPPHPFPLLLYVIHHQPSLTNTMAPTISKRELLDIQEQQRRFIGEAGLPAKRKRKNMYENLKEWMSEVSINTHTHTHTH